MNAIHARRTWLSDLIILLSWPALLAFILNVPFLSNSPTPGDDLTRYTVRLALGYYALAVACMMTLHAHDWTATAGRGRIARWCWTLGWAAYLIHLAMAFHHYHHWSHTHAMEHTRTVSGVGEGIYLSHLFTLAWTMDVLAWWLWPGWYATRPAWIGRTLHAFMFFMIFNATVVYGTGLIRWAGAALFAVLLALRLTTWRQSATAGRVSRSTVIGRNRRRS
jgi:hypothetical protein